MLKGLKLELCVAPPLNFLLTEYYVIFKKNILIFVHEKIENR